MKTTQEYFNLTADQLQEVINEHGYTKEEALLFDASEYTRLYVDADNALTASGWWRSQGYVVKEILLLTDGRAAILANVK